MKCPNIYCIARDSENECSQGDFADDCDIRKQYEYDNCPDEEEYNSNIKKLIDGEIDLPF